MPLYKNRICTTSTMRFVSYSGPGKIGPVLTFKDDLGAVTYLVGASYQGATEQALRIDSMADLPLAVGREVSIWFGINGGPERLGVVNGADV